MKVVITSISTKKITYLSENKEFWVFSRWRSYQRTNCSKNKRPRRQLGEKKTLSQVSVSKPSFNNIPRTNVALFQSHLRLTGVSKTVKYRTNFCSDWGAPMSRCEQQIKGPCSPKRLCALVFLLWNDSFVKCSVLIGFHFEERCVTILKTTARETTIAAFFTLDRSLERQYQRGQ